MARIPDRTESKDKKKSSEMYYQGYIYQDNFGTSLTDYPTSVAPINQFHKHDLQNNLSDSMPPANSPNFNQSFPNRCPDTCKH